MLIRIVLVVPKVTYFIKMDFMVKGDRKYVDLTQLTLKQSFTSKKLQVSKKIYIIYRSS